MTVVDEDEVGVEHRPCRWWELLLALLGAGLVIAVVATLQFGASELALHLSGVDECLQSPELAARHVLASAAVLALGALVSCLACGCGCALPVLRRRQLCRARLDDGIGSYVERSALFVPPLHQQLGADELAASVVASHA